MFFWNNYCSVFDSHAFWNIMVNMALLRGINSFRKKKPASNSYRFEDSYLLELWVVFISVMFLNIDQLPLINIICLFQHEPFCHRSFVRLHNSAWDCARVVSWNDVWMFQMSTNCCLIKSVRFQETICDEQAAKALKISILVMKHRGVAGDGVGGTSNPISMQN